MRRIALAVVASLAVAAGAAEAFNPQPEPPAFGMEGLGRYQTAALNAVLTTPPDPNHPGCGVELSFVDARGQVLQDRTGTEFKKTFLLRGNAAVALIMPAAEILADGEARKAIRAVVESARDLPSECVGMVATWEILAPNGWTMTINSLAVPRAPNPPTPGLQ